MLRFGIVSQINPITVQARISFEDDSSTSYWLPVLQTKTLKDKHFSIHFEQKRLTLLGIYDIMSKISRFSHNGRFVFLVFITIVRSKFFFINSIG